MHTTIEHYCLTGAADENGEAVMEVPAPASRSGTIVNVGGWAAEGIAPDDGKQVPPYSHTAHNPLTGTYIYTGDDGYSHAKLIFSGVRQSAFVTVYAYSVINWW